MKIKLRNVFKTGSNGGCENLANVSICFVLPILVWLIYTFYNFLTWNALNWLYIRITIFTLITTGIYLLIIFKIEKNYEK